jgi:lipoprotein-releasing system permease protein
LNLAYFISKRIAGKDRENFSGPVMRIARLAIALGVGIMILSVAVLTGFQMEIREKVIGFGAHLQIDNFDIHSSYEAKPVSMDQPFYPNIARGDKDVEHIQVFAYKAGIIKTEEQIEGVVLKGIGPDFRWDFFSDKIIEGEKFMLSDTATSNDVLISGLLADKLLLKTGDPLRMYFIGEGETRPRGRRFNVKGIYETGLEEFDKMYVLGDIRQIRRLNNWNDDEVSGFEIFINDFSNLDEVTYRVYSEVGYDLNVVNVREAYPQIFDWLKLLDKNVIVILVLMIAVSAITMISTLLILILEKTNHIGILKALGMDNTGIRAIFLYSAAGIIGRGLLWGNLIAILLSILQNEYHIITLDQSSYYVDFVPVNLNFVHILLVNAGAFIACMAMLLIPSYIISRITPVKAIRFS